MTKNLFAGLCFRALLSINAICMLAVPTRGEDVDVFELLTGQNPPPIATPEAIGSTSASNLAEQPVGPVVDLGVEYGNYAEPIERPKSTELALITDVEEVRPGSEQPTPYSEMNLRRSINELSASPTTPEFIQSMNSIPEKFQIRNLAASQFGSWTDPRVSAMYLDSGYAPSGFAWAAPAVFHRPLYFEQPNVERYGHYVSCCKGGNCAQSAICAAHFFGTIPLLPYKIGADPCCERQYVLGTYRPGSCNPHQLVRPELSCRGLIVQGVTVTGLVFLIP